MVSQVMEIEWKWYFQQWQERLETNISESGLKDTQIRKVVHHRHSVKKPVRYAVSLLGSP